MGFGNNIAVPARARQVVAIFGAGAALLAGLWAVTAPDAAAIVVPSSGTQEPDLSAASLVTPSGTTITAGNVVQLHPTSAPNPAAVRNATAGAADNTFTPGAHYMTVAPMTDGSEFGQYSDIDVPQNDGQYHDWATFTLTFSRPVADPVITYGSVGGLDISQTGYDGLVTTTIAIREATAADGTALTPSLTLANFTPGYSVDTSGAIVPAPGTYGTETANRTGAPAGNHAEIQALLNAAVPGANLASVPRGSGEIRIGTGGTAVSSVTVVMQLGVLHIVDTGEPGIVALASTRLSVQLDTEVSGSTTPATYGAATHIVTDLRLGQASQAAFPTTALSEPTAGTAVDNSDGGYDSLSPADITAFAGSFNALQRGRQVTLSIPLSGVSAPAGVAGWIDFNANGTFDAGEGSGVVTVGAGSTAATLAFTVPQDVAAGATWMRLRTGYDVAQLAGPTGWGDSGEVEDYPITIAAGTPAVLLTKVDDLASGATPAVGDQVTYTITVTNQSATQVVPTPTISDPLPANLTFVSASDGGALQGGAVVWTLPDIAAGGSVSVTVTAQLTAAPPTTVNTAFVTTPAGCETLGQDAQCEDSATFPAPHPVLNVVKTGPATTTPLGQLAYTITVTNAGDVDATGVVVSDMLPAGATFGTMTTGPAPVDPSASVLVWQLPGTLAVGQSLTLAFTVDLDDTVHVGDTETNRAAATSDQGCWPSADTSCTSAVDTDVVAPAGQLTTIKTATIVDAGTRTVAGVGDQITYEIQVTNATSLPVILTGVADPLLDDAGVSIDCGALPATLAPAATLTCTTAPYTVTAADLAAGQVLNVATPAGTFPNNDPVPATPGQAATPTATVVLDVAKTAGAQVAPGGVLTYQITVTNPGPVPAHDVLITDPLPAGLTFGAAPDAPPYQFDGTTLTWALPLVDIGSSVTVTFTAQVAADAVGTVTNTAAATSSGGCAPASGTGECAASAATEVIPPSPTPTPTPTGSPSAAPTPTSSPSTAAAGGTSGPAVIARSGSDAATEVATACGIGVAGVGLWLLARRRI